MGSRQGFRPLSEIVTVCDTGHSRGVALGRTQSNTTVAYSEGNLERKGIFHYGHDVLQSRWVRMQSIFKNSSGFSLQELKPDYCNFFKEVSDPSPDYAWIFCNHEEDKDCLSVMYSAGIIGHSGSSFGSSDCYVRLAMLKRPSNFENLAARLAKLVAQT